MTNHHSEDLPRDKRLLAALRHAPDHDAAPPAEVSARILAKAAALARQGSQQAAPSAPVRWQQAMMGWFRLPHFAAAFGTLAAGTLLGLLWSTQGPPDATAPPVSPQVVIAPVESMRDAATAPATKPEARPASAQAKLAESRATPPVLARADKDAAPQSLSKHKEEKAMPMRQEVDEAARLRSLAGATAPAPAAAPAPAVAQAQMAAKAAAAEAVTDRKSVV